MIATPCARAVAQDNSSPLTKDELINVIKQSGPRPRISQGDIAEAVERRGIGFKLDEQTIEELKQAGAKASLIESIKHSVEDAGRSKQIVRNDDYARAGVAAGDHPLSLIEETRRHALAFASELPNFVVTQKVTRYVQAPVTKGKWQQQDTIDIDLTYEVGSGEQRKVVKIDGKPTTKSYDELHLMTSIGEFGSGFGFAFGSGSILKEGSHDTLRGRDTIMYDFKSNHANRTVDSGVRPQGIPQGSIAIRSDSASGRVWIDPTATRVLRMELTMDLPPSTPISLNEIAIDYDWAIIEGNKYLLPVHAEVLSGIDSQKYYLKNVIEFVNYRKWEGRIKLVPNSN